MARRTRMYIPGYSYHVVQRGNNRAPCFLDGENYFVYLKYLRELLDRYRNALHAYCLMTNHVHLLITPDTCTGISDLMKVLNSRYAQYMNSKYERTGTLWEGRHKASAIDSESYLLRCYRYIELNPVRAKMVDSPEKYLWSSYLANSSGEPTDLIQPHSCYMNLGATKILRGINYRQLFEDSHCEGDIDLFKKAASASMPVGTEQFILGLAEKLGRSIGHPKKGRPIGT